MMLNMEKKPERNEENRNCGSLFDCTDDCHGLVAGDEDVLWLNKKDIWLYRCWSCNGVYYAYKMFWPQRRCPYCKYDSNEPLDNYYDIKKAIDEIEERDPYEQKTIQQIIEEVEKKGG